jgi:hypothetical protein
MKKTNSPNLGLNDLDPEIAKVLHEAQEFGLKCEVIASAFQALENNPKLSILEALEIGKEEWIK